MRYTVEDCEGRKIFKETDGPARSKKVTIDATQFPVGTVLEVRDSEQFRPALGADVQTLERLMVQEVGGVRRWNNGLLTIPLHASEYPEGTEVSVRRPGISRTRLSAVEGLCAELIEVVRQAHPQTATIASRLLKNAKELPL